MAKISLENITDPFTYVSNAQLLSENGMLNIEVVGHVIALMKRNEKNPAEIKLVLQKIKESHRWTETALEWINIEILD